MVVISDALADSLDEGDERDFKRHVVSGANPEQTLCSLYERCPTDRRYLDPLARRRLIEQRIPRRPDDGQNHAGRSGYSGKLMVGY